MDDLAEFLRARLDEDEAAARRVNGSWCEEPEAIGVILVDGEPLIEGHITGLTAHIARHDPARVLREVEAGRAVLDEYDHAYDEGMTPGLAFAVAYRAAVYSDHPDYRQEWKP